MHVKTTIFFHNINVWFETKIQKEKQGGFGYYFFI